MKSSAIVTLLFASVTMNLFTLAGYVRARTETPADDPAALVTSELQLNEQQQTRYRLLRSEMDHTVEYCRGNQALLKQEILDEIRSEAPDADRIMELMEQSAELERTLRADAAARFGSFVSGLAPDQRESLSRAMRRSRHGRGGHDRRLAQFDKNQDGRLDEAERAEASAFFEKNDRVGSRRSRGGTDSRGGSDRRSGGDDGRWSRDRDEDRDSDRDETFRRQLERRFDANDDNALDEAEVEALLKWLRTRPESHADTPAT